MSKLSAETRATLGPGSRLVHAGRDPFEQHGFINTPIYRGSTVLYETTDKLRRRDARFVYGTKGTPTTESLESAWTEIAEAAGTVLTPSGLAAITVGLLSVVRAGDHVLVTDAAYQPIRHFCDTVLVRLGVETTYYDPALGRDVAAHFRPSTRLVLVEAPGSQTLDMQDVPAIVAVARDRDICVVMDNTWATSLMFPAHRHGVDIVVEAGTKYLSGHSDLLLGLTTANARYWPQLRATFDAFAMCAGAEDVFLALRGLRTMALRLREAERRGLAMAQWFAARPEVARVLHPALPDHPGHDLWKRDFSGSSGLFSVILQPATERAVAALLDGLELFGLGYSWGGYESLVIPFDCSSYRTATTWKPGGPALRFSIGLEDTVDLQADLDRGFARLRSTT